MRVWLICQTYFGILLDLIGDHNIETNKEVSAYVFDVRIYFDN